MTIDPEKELRSVVPLPESSMRGVTPAPLKGRLPKVEWVEPRLLYIEGDYQRGLGESGIKQIRRIVGHWNWRHYKPPCVTRRSDTNILVVIDGQHTAIAAASHGGIPKIPVFIVEAGSMAERATAFVSHNRDRRGLTQMQIHVASVAAGDPVALQVDQVCKAAGVTILLKPINSRETRGKLGETIAVTSIERMVRHRGVAHATAVLSVLVSARRSPVLAREIGASSDLIAEGAVADTLSHVIARHTQAEWSAMAAAEIAGGATDRKALAVVWRKALAGVRRTDAVKRAPVFVPKPKPALPPKPESPPPAAKPEPESKPIVLKMGVAIDASRGAVGYRGKVARLNQRSARLVGVLANVAPSMLTCGDAAQRAGISESLLSNYVIEANILLRPIGLHIKPFGKMGLTLVALD